MVSGGDDVGGWGRFVPWRLVAARGDAETEWGAGPVWSWMCCTVRFSGQEAMDGRDWAGLAEAPCEKSCGFAAMFSGQEAVERGEATGLSGVSCKCRSGCSF